MKTVIATERKPIKMWLTEAEIEGGALEQVRHLANLPFAFHHVAIMPDAHLGYGMPIGGVLATDRVIIPNAVGVDIGCGMNFVATDCTPPTEVSTLKKVMGRIREAIPVGFEHHKEQQDIAAMPEWEYCGPVAETLYESARYQVGTLGGGNHFIELQRDDRGNLAVMIHSGSRNLGKKVADYYNKVAVDLNKKWYSSIPEDWQLAFLPIDSEEGRNYRKDMEFCVSFAFYNRTLMMDRIKAIISEGIPGIVFSMNLDIAHNYAAMEHHFGADVMVHRKGATRAREGEIGIIPGSQGAHSYIVRGKGNPDSFMSCSHGAGRRMGRNQACKTLSLADEVKKMDDLGIVHSIRTERDLDEAAGAYKDIETVMGNQEDLVEIVTELSPLGVIKG